MDIIKPYHPRSQSPSKRVGIFLERSNSSCHMTSPRCPPKGVSASIGCELHQIPKWYFSNRTFSVHHRMHMPLRAFLKRTLHCCLLAACTHTHNRWVVWGKHACMVQVDILKRWLMAYYIFYTSTIHRACKISVCIGRTHVTAPATCN